MSKALVPIGSEKAGSELIQLVSFSLDNEEYAVEVLKVREIIRMPEITHMPNTPHYAEGIINLRGKVIPVISLRKKFSLMDTENDSHTRVMVMDINGELTGFIVDSVSEVIRISSSEVQPPPSAMASCGVEQEYITGVVNRSERLLILLDLDHIIP
ncbi:MAG TPA: chemotaxis protein CheW [Deltaproteobacteria bacterium]|nr:chemotaxis protein CheW [Deltaproteobacteria bacterium]